MIPYSNPPINTILSDGYMIHSFINSSENNISWETIDSFGEEWQKFSDFEKKDLDIIGLDYFDQTELILNSETIALDVGCGSGRWAKYLSPKVKFIEAIDPSKAVFTALRMTKDIPNIRITQAGVESIPFDDNSFDFVYSLGVLHHLPDTTGALKRCIEKLKPGGWLLIYLYYNLDNRAYWYRGIFLISNFLRKIISRLPKKIKFAVCDIIALMIYFPFAKLNLVVNKFSPNLAAQLPLAYYSKTSFRIMQNDALDRFGTPLEKRFSKAEIRFILENLGLTNITFSNQKPYWHVIAQK